MHPDFIGALMADRCTLSGLLKNPSGNWTLQLIRAAIEADPVWPSTKATTNQLPKEKHPMPGVAFGWSGRRA